MRGPGASVLVVRLALVVLALGACGDKPTSDADASTGGDTSTVDTSTICEGQCRQTSLTAMFVNTRTLDSAYYGTNFDTQAVRIEAYRKAPQGCPTGSSQTPDYTLVLAQVAPAQPSSNTSPANILDFKGDLLGGPLGLAAMMKQIDTAAWVPNTFVAVDVNLTFSSGTVTGHIYATHCTTLDN